jgi:predicted thioesterase
VARDGNRLRAEVTAYNPDGLIGEGHFVQVLVPRGVLLADAGSRS